MSQVIEEPFDSEKHDPALDSGVCPSPNESCQSYFEAFPALSACSNTKTSNKTFVDAAADDEYFVEKFRSKLNSLTSNKSSKSMASNRGFSPLSWQYAKRPYNDDSSQTSSASWPTQQKANFASLFQANLKSNVFFDAPSPTNADVTPHKRQKVVEKHAGPVDFSYFSLAAFQNETNNGSTRNVHPTETHRDQLKSCPNLNADCTATNRSYFCRFNYEDASLDKSKTQKVASSRCSSPRFVVPKTFHVGSWPLKNSDLRAYGDVPFWQCTEWFCTEHKSLQFSLLAAKSQQDASRFLKPHSSSSSSSFEPSAAAAKYFSQREIDDLSLAAAFLAGEPIATATLPASGAGAYSNEADDDLDVILDDLLPNDVGGEKVTNAPEPARRSGSMTSSSAASSPLVDFDSPSPVVVFFDESVESEIDDWRKRRTVQRMSSSPPSKNDDDDNGGDNFSDESMTFDAPQFILHIINDNDSQSSNDEQQEKAVLKSGKDKKNAQAPNFVDLDAYWPSETSAPNPNTSVPEFELFPSALNLHIVPPPNDVGFCVPKFDLSSANVHSSAKASSSFLNPKVADQSGTNAAAAPVAIPISPDTHFVPIRSESMEDAYILKPHFDDTLHVENLFAFGTRGNVSYIEDLDYYVYLEPEKPVDTSNGSDDSVQHFIRDLGEKAAPSKPSTPSDCPTNIRNALVRQLNARKNQQATVKDSPKKSEKCAKKVQPKNRSSLPLKFRALKPGKMVQTEDKYFVDKRNDSLDTLPDLSTFPMTIGSENRQHRRMSSSENSIFMDIGGIDFCELIANPNNSNNVNWASLLGLTQFHFDQINNNNSNETMSNAIDEKRVLDEHGFQIWVPLARKLSPIEEIEPRWPSSVDIKRQLDILNENMPTSTSSYENANACSASLHNSFSAPVVNQSATFLESSSSCKSNKSSFYTNTRNSSTMPSLCKSSTSDETGGDLEMLRKQDKRDEELLLKYVSNISLVSPLEKPLFFDENSSENG